MKVVNIMKIWGIVKRVLVDVALKWNKTCENERLKTEKRTKVKLVCSM